MGGQSRSNRIIGFVGVKGAGKTQGAMEFFRRATRAFVIDPMAEYEGGIEISAHVDTVDYLCGTDRFRVIYRPLEQSDFLFACRCVWRTRNVTFIVEELGRYCEPASIPDEFDEIVSRGRHRCIDLIYTCQRFQQIHKNVTAMTDEWYVFRQTEPVDLEQVERRFGKNVSQIVRDLDDLEAVHIRQKEFRAHDSKSFGIVSVVPRRGIFPHRASGNRAIDHRRSGAGAVPRE